MIHLSYYYACLGILSVGWCINLASLEAEAEAELRMPGIDCGVVLMKAKSTGSRTGKVRLSESNADLLSVKGKWEGGRIG